MNNPSHQKSALLQSRLRAEARFQLYCKAAVLFAVAILFLLVGMTCFQARYAFLQSRIQITAQLDPAVIDADGLYAQSGKIEDLLKGDFLSPLIAGLALQLEADKNDPVQMHDVQELLSRGGSDVLRRMLAENPALLGQTINLWVPASSDLDMAMKYGWGEDIEQDQRRLNDAQTAWGQELAAKNMLQKKWSWDFMTSSDSREAELAGIAGSFIGSLWTMLITILFALPVGIMAAIYLEEFAAKSRLTRFIEMNINNLASVPSIVFGLLGLAIFLGFFGLPRSAPLAGGLVLGLMTLPVIIIASRSALSAVPPSIRDGALALGASPLQATFHHVLPQAVPGIMTGSIIGMARALGETAPLLMIGMVAFVAVLPQGPLSAASALPVQIFLWADSPEKGYLEKTAAAIIILLVFLVLMNLMAFYLRHRAEKK